MITIAKYRNRKQKEKEYKEKYSNIPLELESRLNYMCDLYNINESKMNEILMKRHNMLSNLQYYDLSVVVLYEEPEGTQRSRFRLINRQNFNKEALANSAFVHVYSPNAKDDHVFMRRLVDEELIALDGLINTPCIVEYNAFLKTPNSFNITDKVLAEIGIIRPVMMKPDWDNIGKKYCDMYNHNVWLDDSLVIDGTVRKYYSILPRVEIRLRYLNCVYNKVQYNTIINRKDYDNKELFYINNKGEIDI